MSVFLRDLANVPGIKLARMIPKTVKMLRKKRQAISRRDSFILADRNSHEHTPAATPENVGISEMECSEPRERDAMVALARIQCLESRLANCLIRARKVIPAIRAVKAPVPLITPQKLPSLPNKVPSVPNKAKCSYDIHELIESRNRCMRVIRDRIKALDARELILTKKKVTANSVRSAKGERTSYIP